MEVGDSVKHVVTGKVYRVREIKRTRVVVQRGSIAIEMAIEKIQVVSK